VQQVYLRSLALPLSFCTANSAGLPFSLKLLHLCVLLRETHKEGSMYEATKQL
jgi:hypothetical protein